MSLYTHHFCAYVDTHELGNFKSHITAHVLLKYYYIFLRRSRVSLSLILFNVQEVF